MGWEMPEQSQNRQVAFKVRIAELLSGRYVKEEGWNPNYILTKSGRRVSRVNLMGAVVSTPTVELNYRSMNLDDGSSQISIRSFDESDMFRGINMGDVVFVIGRPRQYNNQIYIMPEIVKKVQNKLWIEVRKLEIEKETGKIEEASPAKSTQQEAHKQNAVKTEQVGGEEVIEESVAVEEKVKNKEPKQGADSPQQKIYSMIKELDKGGGAGFEEILEKSGLADAENIISQLLMEGEIFELGKGKLKVLE